MTEAAGTCETSVNFYHTAPGNIPEDNQLFVPGSYVQRREGVRGFADKAPRIPKPVTRWG
jgi:hypothetical protein